MRIRSSAAACVAAALAVSFMSSPAHAASAPKPGASCMMSGESRIVNGRTFVCEQGANASTWSKGLKRSSSSLQIEDQWVKAAESGMTAAFGVITNPTNKSIRIIGARSPRFAGVMQLHEVAMKDGAMQMMEKEGGFVVPAGGSIELKPGGDHLMFMQMRQPIAAGEMVPIMLITSDGGQLRFTAMGRVFAGANENYDDNGGGMNHGGMNHGGMS